MFFQPEKLKPPLNLTTAVVHDEPRNPPALLGLGLSPHAGLLELAKRGVLKKGIPSAIFDFLRNLYFGFGIEFYRRLTLNSLLYIHNCFHQKTVQPR